jgi:hypothetical protein
LPYLEKGHTKACCANLCFNGTTPMNGGAMTVYQALYRMINPCTPNSSEKKKYIYLSEYRLILTFTDGKRKIFDVEPFMGGKFSNRSRIKTISSR